VWAWGLTIPVSAAMGFVFFSFIFYLVNLV
jgi:hypothetical protein